jgi:hypothetical protein
MSGLAACKLQRKAHPETRMLETSSKLQNGAGQHKVQGCRSVGLAETKNKAGPAVAHDDELEAGKHRRLSCRKVVLGRLDGVVGDEDAEGEMERLSRTKTLADGRAWRRRTPGLQGWQKGHRGRHRASACCWELNGGSTETNGAWSKLATGTCGGDMTLNAGRQSEMERKNEGRSGRSVGSP